ncbi:MAG: transcription-repair coupling factor [Verrucomicrobiota bacterium]|nr:transcription-repair coupling factor [Verrucomicrobiota bacterium]
MAQPFRHFSGRFPFLRTLDPLWAEHAWVGIADAAPSSWSLLTALIALRQSVPTLVVVPDSRAQDRFLQDLFGYVEVLHKETALDVLPFPVFDLLLKVEVESPLEETGERLTALQALDDWRPSAPRVPIVVAPITAMMHGVPLPRSLERFALNLTAGRVMARDAVVQWLLEAGYEEVGLVEAKGQFAVRGGIIDLFSVQMPGPVRVEFFGDEVDSMRLFDPVTQLQRESLTALAVFPADEAVLAERAVGESSVCLAELFQERGRVILTAPDELESCADQYAAQLATRRDDTAEWLMPERVWRALAACRGVVLESGSVLSPPVPIGPLPAPARIVAGLVATEAMEMVETGDLAGGVENEARRKQFFQQLQQWRDRKYVLWVFCNNAGERTRFEEILEESGLGAIREDAIFVEAGIGAGFAYDAGRLAVVTDAEIFGRYKILRPRRRRGVGTRQREHPFAAGDPIGQLTDLDFGDYVVHAAHGIGRYLGMKTIAVDGERREVLTIEYANGVLFYVGLDQAHLVTRYVGVGKRPPKLDRLDGLRWRKSRKEAEAGIETFAVDLLKLQAMRQQQEGHAFRSDTAWQREFESSFLFEETEDQLLALTQVKGDMECARPMDRLLCGDVGFGKTEVAIRAAFKAVMDGKQVAVLVPTTVLAQQHYNTFCERMADYPVVIDMLSRFRTDAQQREILARIQSGSLDIVIGTHRLVQSDVAFHDLGLVIVDEEQRFGVMQKEQLKALRTMVDVLTMTATPIPRTLYFALTGMRDLSTINTAPLDRLPVETRVVPYEEGLVREAILHEVNRSGQVFFLHNRVQTIERVAAKLEALVPEARFVVGHGQMPEHQLEAAMLAFIRGDADVLVCTTIIESGIDIPNANTILIDRADRFGLAELYQLRGRVGRYKNQAYAYLLVPRGGSIRAVARDRLAAIKRYCGLGSGFRLAMRDLEIRGAGNLLGKEQSGHIANIGFDLYCQLLRNTLERIQGGTPRELPTVTLRLDFLLLGHSPEAGRAGAFLPEAYIPEEALRLEAYRRLASSVELEEIDELGRQWRDRFGVLPEPARLLQLWTRLRITAAAAGIRYIEVKESKLMMRRSGPDSWIKGPTRRFPRVPEMEAAAKLEWMLDAIGRGEEGER